MRWLKKILQYRNIKMHYIMQNKLIKAVLDRGYITNIQYYSLITKNEKFKTRFKHAVAVCDIGKNIYKFSIKTTTEKTDGNTNIKFEENMYIGNEIVKVQFKTEKEFLDNFKELNPNMQKRLFKDEETQEAFLKSAEKESVNLNIIDSTLDFYLEEYIFQLAYLNKMQAGFNEEELKLFQEEFDSFFNEFKIEYLENLDIIKRKDEE